MATIKVRRNTIANIPTLQNGEPFWAQDKRLFYMGTGSQNILVSTMIIADIVGDGSTDDAPAINDALDFAYTFVQSGTRVSVYVPHGICSCESQIVVHLGVMFICDAILVNNISGGTYTPVLYFDQYSCQRGILHIDCNNACGVLCGGALQYNAISLDTIKAYNVGDAAYNPTYDYCYGIKFLGYVHNFRYIEIANNTSGGIATAGGRGVFFSGATDIHGQSIQTSEVQIGCTIGGCTNVQISELQLDTCYYTGGLIDQSDVVVIQNIHIFQNEENPGSDGTGNCGAASSGYGFLVGEYSSGRINTQLDLNFNVKNVGGSAVKVSYVNSGIIKINTSNDLLYTPHTLHQTSAITYGLGNGIGLQVFLNVDKSITTPVVGDPTGTTLDGVYIKADTGDPTYAYEGMRCGNPTDNNYKIYLDGAWRTLTTW